MVTQSWLYHVQNAHTRCLEYKHIYEPLRKRRIFFADTIAYGIYTSAAFHKRQQPNRNLHFSPSNSHKRNIGKNWNTTKLEKNGKSKNAIKPLYQTSASSNLYKNQSQR
ncbi:hypothetical protein C1H46_012511 [Malus baccata]|uniref:Uncharacterized protein n=1 Tax=Malus baccata TaxID=106549 RepID=A0A540MSV9_MALBA|nr:hypothetical protein C1H46_012511 [Malus baccata]